MKPFFKKTFNHIQNDSFLKNNVIFFIGSLLVAFLNYLYYPIMGRIMSVEEFGEVQTIFSLVFLSGVILTVFRMIVLNITTNDRARQLPTATISLPISDLLPRDKSEPLLRETDHSISALYTLALFIHLPFLTVLLFASPFISHFFSFESSWSFSVFSL
jgi:hypothetical protein